MPNSHFPKIIISIFTVLLVIIIGFFIFQFFGEDSKPKTDNLRQTNSDSENQPVNNQNQEEITPPAETVQPTRCIITVNSNKYDVTELQKTHSGGNIFRCGEDMTRDFNRQHGMYFNKIKPYLID